MAFQPKASLPGLTPEQARSIIEQFRAVGAELTALGIPAETVSELVAVDRVAEVGELIRCCPPAGDMAILLPPAGGQNKGDSIRLMVESVASGGAVNVAVVGGQLMNGAATLAITSVGLTEFTSLGPSGWGFLAAGGGGGLTDGVYGSITVSGGGTILRVTDGVYGDVTVSGGGLTWTVAPPAAAVAFLSVEVNLGSVPTWSGSFTIAGAGMTIGKPVLIQQAVGPYTGKGGADEAQDQVTASASVTSAVLITAHWSSTQSPIIGNVIFNYLVGA